MASRFVEEHFIAGGKPAGKPFQLLRKPAAQMCQTDLENTVIGNFIEVFLAKEDHHGPVGVNYLEKIQLPTLPALFGSMLAGVDYVLMGGGLPLYIPGVLDGLSHLDAVTLRLNMSGSRLHTSCLQRFDPCTFCAGERPQIGRPKFLAVISSSTAAKTMVRRSTGNVDGFVIENHAAGGHNAPPRTTGGMHSPPSHQYGPKDVIDTGKIRALGLPFWLAGGCASPTALRDALDAGAVGVQIGTAFAFCEESGISGDIKRQVIQHGLSGHLNVVTDFQASPTGYPFKLIPMGANAGASDGKAQRQLICDLGYLRHLYHRSDHEIGYRCPAEPTQSYLKKGGRIEKTVGKRCLCNGLLATIGLGQIRDDVPEPPVVTSGEDLSFMHHVINGNGATYDAEDVIEYVTSDPISDS